MSKWQNIVKRDRDDFRTTGKAVYQRRLDSIKEGKSPFEDLEGLLGDYETGELYKFEKEIMKELSLNNKAAAGTVLRKLQSVMRNNASTNYGARLELLKNLDADLLPALAGQSLNQLTPRGIQRAVGGGQIAAGAFGAVDPVSLIPSLALQSPRLAGETALKIGQSQRLLNRIPVKNTLRRTRPLVSAIEGSEEEAQKNYIKNLLGTSSNSNSLLGNQ